ncbi:MAG: succinate--CoA ligase subunit alpha [Methanomassiliicoccales archaeon]|nr:succinate--CoA ligase subunit alpha [Methanomassiliicoccales archaeon]
MGPETKVLVQGITGHQGEYHTESMLESGTKVVAGVTPGRGGSKVRGVSVFDSVEEAISSTGANASVVFVPARFALDAVLEAVEAGLKAVVVISEHIPQKDAIIMIEYGHLKGCRILGPNCPGVTSSRYGKIGIMPAHIFKKGKVGVVSRSGTLTYEIVSALTEAGIGQSTCIGIGGDRIVGTSLIEALDDFEADPDTESIVLVGEIGGTAEEDAAKMIKERITKPVVAYIAGRTAPPGKRMGHAGAMISRGAGTASSKIDALTKAGVKVASSPAEIPALL